MRVEDGERTIGAKLGLTSRAKQQRMGVDTPIVGFLTNAMLFEADRVARDLRRWVQPRIEPEIVFVTAQDISAPITLDEAAILVDSVTVGAEILDSRFTGYRFGIGDVIADNTSAAGALLGPPHRLDRIGALASLSCVVEVDGVIVHETDAVPLRTGHTSPGPRPRCGCCGCSCSCSCSCSSSIVIRSDRVGISAMSVNGRSGRQNHDEACDDAHRNSSLVLA